MARIQDTRLQQSCGISPRTDQSSLGGQYSYKIWGRMAKVECLVHHIPWKSSPPSRSILYRSLHQRSSFDPMRPGRLDLCSVRHPIRPRYLRPTESRRQPVRQNSFWRAHNAQSEGIHRQKFTVRKNPWQWTWFKAIVDMYASPFNLLHHRFILTCLLGFTGFLRISELLETRIRDIAFHDDCVKIVIPKSKTDQVREGHLVHIVRSNGSYCSVSWLERYISDANFRQPNYFLICRMSKTKEGHLTKGIHPLRDGTVRENFQKYLAPLCGDDKKLRTPLPTFRWRIHCYQQRGFRTVSG